MEPNQQYKVEIFSKFSMVGAESVQAPVKFSPFVILRPFAKIILINYFPY
uniref:NADH dehydrogenase (Ubiquinone) 1 alpha subcomplex, 4 n=1 Tax=Nothobranchius rachovii TaxID=451742 RepID=A0A1A8QTY2_9TELE